MGATADFVARVNTAIINPVIAFFFIAGLLVFFWGGFQFIFYTGNGTEQKREEGKQHMLWGVIGMLIMVSVFSILQIGLRTFGVTNENLPDELPLHV